MFDQFDEAELLALIEGELDPQRADALRQCLARDPDALSLIDRLTADRTMLRAETAPELPVDFLAELEPRMARPMLVGPSPTELRRQHRRRHRRPWGLMAAAAVAIALLGGLWALVSGVLPLSHAPAGPGVSPRADRSSEPNVPATGDDESLLALANIADSGNAPPADTAIRGETSTDVAMSDALHPPASDTAGAGASKSESGPTRAVAPGDTVPAADFALAFQADDVSGAGQTLQQVIAELGLSVALVRNFSYEEAQRLEQEWLLSGGPQIEVQRSDDLAGPAATRGAISAPRDLRVLADRARQQMRVRRADLAVDDLPTSEQLYGPKELAPSFEAQLELSSRGAAYTITIPANQLSTLLARLAVARGDTTVLRMLMPDDALGTAKELDARSRWLSDYRQVRAAAAQLVKERGDGMILLPVVIEQPEKP